MVRFTTLFFDLFHTLVDVNQASNQLAGMAGTHTADLLGLDREQWNAAIFSELHEIRKPTRHYDVIRTLAHSLNTDIKDELICDAVEQRQRRFDHALVNVEPATLEVLSKLRQQGYGLCLISNASTAEVSAWPKSPLAPLFNEVVFSCACGYAKPDPDIYNHALNRMQVTPEESVFVGDGGSNEHQGANETGMYTVMISRFISSLPVEQLQARRALARSEIHVLDELFDLLAAMPVVSV